MVEHVAREPVQSRAHRTRAALLSAAAREFDASGYAGTTTKSIAERAGVAAGSFYQYFAHKDAVLREVARGRLAALHERLFASIPGNAIGAGAGVDDAARATVAAIVDETLAYHRRDTGLHAVLTERRHADAELDAMTTAFERELVARVEALLEALGHVGDARAQAFMICSLVEGAVHGHVLGARVISDRRFRRALTDAVMTLVRGGGGGAAWKS